MENWLGFQIKYLLLLQNFREATNGIFDGFFANVTCCGEWLLAFLTISFVYWIVDKKCGIYLAFNYFLGILINQFIKITACIYRPWILDSRIHPTANAMKMATGYSFPSGHTAIATSIWGGLAVKFWNNKFLRYALIFLVLLVGFSRNYLLVHTPQDVVVSLILGVFILWGNIKLLDWVDKSKNRDWILFGAVLVICTILIAYTELKHYPLDYFNGKILVDPVKMTRDSYPKVYMIVGAFLGWILDRKLINFETINGSIYYKIVFYLVGAYCLSIFLNKGNFFLIGFFITGIYPAVIKLSEILKNKIEGEKNA